MQVSYLSLDSSNFTMGALLGSAGKSSVIQSINENCGGGSYFGGETDPFRDGYIAMRREVLAPIQEAVHQAKILRNTVEHPDEIRPISSVKDLEMGVPPKMYIPILTHPIIRTQLEEGIIDGFGISPDQLPEENVYLRLVNNGTIVVNDHLDEEEPMLEYEFTTEDPELSSDELEAISETYEFIDDWFEDNDTCVYDFTDYPSLHG